MTVCYERERDKERETRLLDYVSVFTEKQSTWVTIKKLRKSNGSIGKIKKIVLYLWVGKVRANTGVITADRLI